MNLPSFSDLVELVSATDEDADHRLPLLHRAQPILYRGADCAETEREFLIEKVERWRYQRLNKFGSNPSENERRMVTLLDVVVSKLLMSPRSPKGTRAAINSPLAGGAEFEAALDSQSPLDAIAQRAAVITKKNFRASQSRIPTSLEPDNSSFPGAAQRWRMRLYAPLYLSNHCVNHCLYCGFRFPNQIERVHLRSAQAIADAEVLQAEGHRHLLVVAGDFPKLTSIEYLADIVSKLAARGFDVSVEIAPQSTIAYRTLARAGATAVTLYQETYQEELYQRLHPRGTKVWFDWRLEALERAAEAGIKRLGLGILLGLADPLFDLRCLIRHGRYLRARFPEVKLAFSLPRIHEAPDDFKSDYSIDDEMFIRLYCALRFSFPDAELVLSTRESPSLRDQLARICITQMSAGSCTAPGGYSETALASPAGEQFPVFDQRSTAAVAGSLIQSGFQVKWDVRE